MELFPKIFGNLMAKYRKESFTKLGNPNNTYTLPLKCFIKTISIQYLRKTWDCQLIFGIANCTSFIYSIYKYDRYKKRHGKELFTEHKTNTIFISKSKVIFPK